MKVKLLIILTLVSCASQKQPKNIDSINFEKNVIENQTDFRLSKIRPIEIKLNDNEIPNSRKGLLSIWYDSEIKKILWSPYNYGESKMSILFLRNNIPILIEQFEISTTRFHGENGAIVDDIVDETNIKYYVLNWKKNDIHTVVIKNDEHKKIELDLTKYKEILRIAKEKTNTGNTIYSKLGD